MTISRVEARAKLEQLHAETAAADPFQPAPPIWIVELHRALNAFAAREQLQRFRLDGVQGVNMAYLHRQVSGVLRVLDRQVTQEPPLKLLAPERASLPGQ